jgi:hypothetical protein
LKVILLFILAFDNTVKPETFINKVLNQILDNQFDLYLDQIVTFVVLLKLKYKHSHAVFERKFVAFLEDRIDTIKRDYKLLFRVYVLTQVHGESFSEDFKLSIYQYSIDEIKNFRQNNEYLSELNDLITKLENQFNLNEMLFKEHKTQIKNFNQ